MRIIVDAHEDIAYNALTFGRDYRKSATETRRLEAETETPSHAGIATLGLPDSMLGRVGVIFATLFVLPLERKTDSWDVLTYETAQQAYELALRQLDYYERLADENPKIRLIKTQADLDAVLETWGDDKEIGAHQQGLVMLMEGADPIIEPKQFEEWYERGIRIVGPAWSRTRYAGGTNAPGGITSLGRELLEIMAGLNTILDLSHLAEEATYDALDRYEGVIIASHSNPRKFSDTDRHLADRMIRALAERDGVMGIVMYNRFLSNSWFKGDPKDKVPFSKVVDAIDYVCQLTGSSAHVGIGSDFDGGFGAESIPEGLDTVSDLWTLGAALQERGYAPDDVTAILGGNMLRKLRQSLP